VFDIIIGHSLKILGPSQKTLRRRGVPSWLRVWQRVTVSERLTKAHQPFPAGEKNKETGITDPIVNDTTQNEAIPFQI